MGELRPVADHLDRVLSLVAPLPAREVPVADALGLVLAADAVAAIDLPGFDNSAMDGYAVRAGDLARASQAAPVEFDVDGDIAAGDTARHVLAPGRTMRIMTGAPMPEGADAVVPVELSDGGTTRAALSLAPEIGRHVRHRGEDVRAGDVVVPAGARLAPGHLALIAAANLPVVQTHPRPRVAIVSTGDELVPVGSALAHGQIVDSNGIMLAALVRAAGAELVGTGHLGDDVSAVRSFLERIPGEPDLVLTTGGISMGAYDPVKEALIDASSPGAAVEFVRVAMRPGMPQGTGRVGPRATPIITLPGNPVSSLVSFHVFVLPAIRALAGLDPRAGRAVETVAAAGWASVAGKADYTRVTVGPGGARPSGGQGSHMLGALSGADGLAVVPADVDRVTAGMQLSVLPLLGQDAPCG